MLTKNDVLDSILAECDICLHLASKLPEGALDYRPAADQRSTLELLRYISFCALGGALAMRDGNWDGYKACAAKAEALAGDRFPAAMQAQKQALRELFDGLSEADLQREATHPIGTKLPLGRALLEISLKWMVGYRMQLFLYAKAAGNDELWTPDCWAGVSMPRDAAPA